MGRPGRSPRIAPTPGVLALVALPFLVRLAYAVEALGQPYLRWNMLVSYLNHQFAADLATGAGAPYALFRSPWYPVLVSWVYRLFGAAPDVVRVIQWLLGACGCLLAAGIARRIFGRTAGVLTLVIGALYAPAFFFEGELLEQSAATFCLVSAVWLIVRLDASRTGTAAVLGASLLYGLAFLMRPDTLLALPMLAAGVLTMPGAGRRPRALRLSAFGAGCLLMLVPLLSPGLFLRVSAKHIDINAAINLYLGSNAEATGIDPRFPETAELDTADPEARRDHMTGLDLAGIRYALGRTGGDMSTVAPFWLTKTRAFIAGHPVGFLELEARKALLFFSGFVNSNQKDIYVARGLSRVLALLVFCFGICVPLGLVIPLAAAGCAVPAPRHHRLLLLAVPAGCLATTLAFFHDERFRYPAVPFMIILASAGVAGLLRASRRGRLGLALILLPALLLSNVDWLGTHQVRWASEAFRMGTMYDEAGEPVAARQAYEQSITADPGYRPALDNLVTLAVQHGSIDETIRFLEGVRTGGAQAPALVTSLASLYAARGRDDEADSVLRDALRLDPSEPSLALALGDLLMRQGRCSEAAPLFRGAMEGGDAGAFAGAGYCLSRLGDDHGALEVLRRGVERFPKDVTLLGLLAQVCGRLGETGEARDLYLRILAIDPGNVKAKELLDSLPQAADQDPPGASR